MRRLLAGSLAWMAPCFPTGVAGVRPYVTVLKREFTTAAGGVTLHLPLDDADIIRLVP